MGLNIKLIFPASRANADFDLEARVKQIESFGHRVTINLPQQSDWSYASSSIEQRLEVFTEAFTNPSTDVVWCARGGYGISDLLPKLRWNDLNQSSQTILVGFSDVSSLHSALYTKFGYQGFHAPMPASPLWQAKGPTADIEKTLKLINGDDVTCEIPLAFGSEQSTIEGKLFGGCLTVLTGIIGTPYFPYSLNDHLLFLEDTDENPGAIVRCFNNFVLSGKLEGVRAVILGHFRNNNAKDEQKDLVDQIVKRCPCPVFKTELFGHTSPNWPLQIGATARIENANKLTWERS